MLKSCAKTSTIEPNDMTTRTASGDARTRTVPAMSDTAIYESILAAVIDQRLPPGARLTEAELCDIYGVARRAVERVLVRLDAAGVVTHERNRGARVAQPTAEDARDVFALRRLVEGEVIRLVSGRLSETARARLVAALAAEHAETPPENDRARIQHSGDFHVLLAEDCGNREIARLVRRLVARTSLITQLYGNAAALDCWHEDHVRLVDLLAEGATEAAADLMERHLQSIENALRLSEPQRDNLDLRAALRAR